MYNYAYVFSINSKVVWSGETVETLKKRVNVAEDLAEIEGLIKHGKAGSHISLTTGEMVFRVA